MQENASALMHFQYDVICTVGRIRHLQVSVFKFTVSRAVLNGCGATLRQLSAIN
jgi:hypothetical protein